MAFAGRCSSCTAFGDDDRQAGLDSLVQRYTGLLRSRRIGIPHADLGNVRCRVVKHYHCMSYTGSAICLPDLETRRSSCVPVVPRVARIASRTILSQSFLNLALPSKCTTNAALQSSTSDELPGLGAASARTPFVVRPRDVGYRTRRTPPRRGAGVPKRPGLCASRPAGAHRSGASQAARPFPRPPA